jgi:hypothetical protein
MILETQVLAILTTALVPEVVGREVYIVQFGKTKQTRVL